MGARPAESSPVNMVKAPRLAQRPDLCVWTLVSTNGGLVVRRARFKGICICQNIQSFDSHATDWTHNRYGEVGEPSDGNVLWVVSPQSTDVRTSMSGETLYVGENHQTQEQNEAVSFFRNPKDQTKLNHDGRGRYRLAEKHPNPVAEE